MRGGILHVVWYQFIGFEARADSDTLFGLVDCGVVDNVVFVHVFIDIQIQSINLNTDSVFFDFQMEVYYRKFVYSMF